MNNKKIVHHAYKSIADMRTDCIDASHTWTEANNTRFENAIKINRTGDETNWFGLPSAQASLDAIHRGNAELTAKLDLHRIKEKLPEAIGLKRQLRRGSEGDELDIHAVYRGATDKAWTSRKRVIRRARGTVQIIVDIGGSFHASANLLASRGLAGAGLAMALERAGYGVSVLGAFGVEDYTLRCKNTLLVSCQIKPSAGKISAGMLASTVCFPGFFRTYGFGAVIRAAEKQKKDVKDNLGEPVSCEPLLPKQHSTTTFVVPTAVRDTDTAHQWIASTIKLLEASK